VQKFDDMGFNAANEMCVDRKKVGLFDECVYVPMYQGCQIFLGMIPKLEKCTK
jgi:hypothetical protein